MNRSEFWSLQVLWTFLAIRIFVFISFVLRYILISESQEAMWFLYYSTVEVMGEALGQRIRHQLKSIEIKDTEPWYSSISAQFLCINKRRCKLFLESGQCDHVMLENCWCLRLQMVGQAETGDAIRAPGAPASSISTTAHQQLSANRTSIFHPPRRTKLFWSIYLYLGSCLDRPTEQLRFREKHIQYSPKLSRLWINTMVG